MSSPGKFITIEGIEGSGKSTQARILVSRLKDAGYDVLSVREPGGTPVGEAIRGILKSTADDGMCPETEMLLFVASRAELVRHVITPALENGTIVVCDRFADSTTAYQGYARGLDIDTVLALNRFACGTVVPDVTILLDVDVNVGLKRLRTRNEKAGTKRDRIESEEASFHERVRAGYLKVAEEQPGRVNVVDGSRDIETVADEVWTIVREAIE